MSPSVFKSKIQDNWEVSRYFYSLLRIYELEHHVFVGKKFGLFCANFSWKNIGGRTFDAQNSIRIEEKSYYDISLRLNRKRKTFRPEEIIARFTCPSWWIHGYPTSKR